jgi:hypothetical protein
MGDLIQLCAHCRLQCVIHCGAIRQVACLTVLPSRSHTAHNRLTARIDFIHRHEVVTVGDPLIFRSVKSLPLIWFISLKQKKESNIIFILFFYVYSLSTTLKSVLLFFF